MRANKSKERRDEWIGHRLGNMDPDTNEKKTEMEFLTESKLTQTNLLKCSNSTPLRRDKSG